MSGWNVQSLPVAKHHLLHVHLNHLDFPYTMRQQKWLTSLWSGADNLFLYFSSSFSSPWFLCLPLQNFKATIWFVILINLVSIDYCLFYLEYFVKLEFFFSFIPFNSSSFNFDPCFFDCYFFVRIVFLNWLFFSLWNLF